MSLVPSINRVTQVVIDGLLSFLFCGKKLILNTLGRIARSYELYAAVKENFFHNHHGICFRGLHRKKLFQDENSSPFVPNMWDQIKMD